MNVLRLSALTTLVFGFCLPLAHAQGLAQGQMFSDATLHALSEADRPGELRRVAAQRVAARPDDVQAVLALAVSSLSGNDAAARQDALQRAQACVEALPKAAPCHYALGLVLGVQAMSEGMLKAARSAGQVRSALTTAHELEPAWYPARGALIEFHLQAPGFMGGSSAKAAELARGAPTPEQARALEARIAMSERKFEPALQTLMALPASLPPALADDVRQWVVQCALGLVNGGQAAQAQPALERLQREHAEDAGPAYALARVRGELGAHEEALKLYEQAARLRGADNWPLSYRTGIAQQQLGRNDAAKASFQRFLAVGKGQKASLEDARKRLAQLSA